MQGERASLSYSSENDSYDYLTANTSLATSHYRGQHNLPQFNISEYSSHDTERRNDIFPLQTIQNVNFNAEHIDLHEDNDTARARSGTRTRASQPTIPAGSSVEGRRASRRKNPIESVIGQSSSRDGRDSQRGESSSSTPASRRLVVSGTGTTASQPSRYSKENNVRAISSVEGRCTSRLGRAIEGSFGQSTSRDHRDFIHEESSLSIPASNVQTITLNAGYFERPEDNDLVRARSAAGTWASQPSNSVRAESSVEGSRKSRKRKVGEAIHEHSSSHIHRGESSSSTPASTAKRPRNGLNISGSRGSVWDSFSPVAERSSRNTSDQQEAVNSAGTVIRRHVGPSRPYLSRNLPAGLRHGQNIFSPNFNAPAIFASEMLPPFEGSLAGGSSNPTLPNERNHHLDEIRSENILEIPATELGNSAPSGNPSISPSLSRTGSTTDVQPPCANLRPFRNLPISQRRRSDLVRRSLIPTEPPTLHSGSDGTMLEAGDIVSPLQNRASLRARPWYDRQGDSVVRIPPSSRAFEDASRDRSNLMVSEEIMLHEAMGFHDQHQDMRLDVDNMSYEELVALEERIGDVCTGVNEETISKQLKLRKYKSSKRSAEDDVKPCCICLEEYTKGEDMGTLECGHDFHSECIKEWLKQKNLCPICKNTALNTSKQRKIRSS